MYLYKMLIKLTMLGVVLALTTAVLAIPYCQRQCGNISIPYPFGTSHGCYIDEEFLITCNNSFNPPKPFLTTSNIEVLNISLEGQLKILTDVGYDCYDSSGKSSSKMQPWLRLSKFFISNTKNKFTSVGCDTFSSFYGVQSTNSSAQCLPSCDKITDVISGSCSGFGCCQTAIPKWEMGFDILIDSFGNHTKVWDFNPCSFAFVAEDGAYNFSSLDLKDLRNITELPLVLDWAVGNQTCSKAIKHPTSYACKGNSYCTNSENGPGYLCSCQDGFQGNPYLTNGCQATTASPAIPNSQTHCGNVSIPFPFGTSNGYYIDKDFHVTCDTTFNPPKPFLTTGSIEVFNNSLGSGETITTGNIEVLNISLDGQLKISTGVAYDCYDSSGKSINPTGFSISLSKFFISNTKNKFTTVGCDTFSSFYGLQSTNVSAQCLTSCENITDVISGSCSGIGCCQTAFPKGKTGFNIFANSFDNHSFVWNFNPCSFAFVVEDGAYNFSSLDLYNLRNITELPLVLDWTIGNQTCDEAKKDPTSYACKENSNCTNSENGPGYLCSCLNGFQGSPYLANGCQDINECETLRPCNSTCNNLPGNYYCSCPVGYEGDGMVNGTGCSPKVVLDLKHQSKGFVLGICTGVVGFFFLLAGAWWLYKVTKKRKDTILKQKFFKRNGGLLLQQQLSSDEVNVEKIKMFNSKELEMATDRFNVDRILGQGGQGTVYKGMLTDGRIVAVKKSKVVDEGKLQQFINEVVILSQINHRNVVKLLGCCLETQVPLLVYEFIPNGTLFQYLHNPNEEFPLTWDMRLRIAIEVAGALSYLHSAASLPIYHRDIKSTNILLDDKYRAKVADFGTSRSVAIDQTHVTTMVHGTMGYLDPEYFQSNQFTEKSDVYSFGVVLVELLTGQKPISSTRTQQGRSLATYFILSMEENCLYDILDAQVMTEERKEEVMVVAKLAKRCLYLNGKKRPTMKEVTVELERIRKSEKALNDSQHYEEVEYARTEIIVPWDVASASTGSGLDSGVTSSFETKHLFSTM